MLAMIVFIIKIRTVQADEACTYNDINFENMVFCFHFENLLHLSATRVRSRRTWHVCSVVLS